MIPVKTSQLSTITLPVQTFSSLLNSSRLYQYDAMQSATYGPFVPSLIFYTPCPGNVHQILQVTKEILPSTIFYHFYSIYIVFISASVSSYTISMCVTSIDISHQVRYLRPLNFILKKLHFTNQKNDRRS